MQRAPDPIDPRRQQQEARRMVWVVQDRQGRQTTKDLRMFMRRHQDVRRGDSSFGHRQESLEIKLRI